MELAQSNKACSDASKHVLDITATHLCSCTLAHTNNPVLVGVEDLPHFAHWLGVSGRRWEVTIQVQPPKQSSPAIVPLCCVRQAPRHQGLTLHSHQIARSWKAYGMTHIIHNQSPEQAVQ